MVTKMYVAPFEMDSAAKHIEHKKEHNVELSSPSHLCLRRVHETQHGGPDPAPQQEGGPTASAELRRGALLSFFNTSDPCPETKSLNGGLDLVVQMLQTPTEAVSSTPSSHDLPCGLSAPSLSTLRMLAYLCMVSAMCH